MGVQLLRKLGWKEGQGVGPRVRKTKKKTMGKSSTHTDCKGNHIICRECPLVYMYVAATLTVGLITS